MRASLAAALFLATGLPAGGAAAADVTPDPFHFIDQAGVSRNAPITSASVTITGLAERAPISVTGGKYSIGCGNKFTAAAGTIDDGDSVCVRHTSADEFATATDTTLTVGGVADTFTSTTLAGDAVPEPFRFIDVPDALMNTLQVSNTVTPRGFDGTVPVEVAGGEYSLGCTGTFTAATGSIAGGQAVCVRHTSAGVPGTATDTTLSVGGTADTFTSTTPARRDLTGTGAVDGRSLLVLLAVLALRRRAGRNEKPARAVTRANESFEAASLTAPALEWWRGPALRLRSSKPRASG